MRRLFDEGKNFPRLIFRSALNENKVDPAIIRAMKHFGAELEPHSLWIKDDKYSMQLRPKKVDGGESFIDKIRDAFTDIPAAPLILAKTLVDRDMMVVYPLFDAHLGMRAHAEISGVEMDLKIGSERVKSAVMQVMAGAPNAYRGVIINGGDFTHQTDDRNMTRRSGHILDVDGRNVFTVLAAVEVITSCIEMALGKHQIVEYYSVPGNHDPQNWETILIALRERYRLNPRVTIYFNFDHARSSEFSVVEHGDVGIFIHHGDKRPPKDLVMFCTAEFREVFGRTKYNLLITGHLHHIKVDEFPGMIWMQMPALAVRDHYSAAGAYKSISAIMALGFDHRGERTRNQIIL
jgi:predicted phosphodiesterase